MKGVIVTGSSSGIGLEIAKKAIRENKKVLGLDISESNLIDINYKHLIIDLSQPYEIPKNSELINCISQFDGLVNSAGITINQPNELNERINVFKKTLNINLVAPYILSELFFQSRDMPFEPSSIVNISSIGARQGFEGNPSYCSSKGGIESLTKSMAVDYACKNIRVNTIRPGYTETPMNIKSLTDPIKKNKRADNTILKRWGKPYEIAEPVFFLLSSKASYITGSTITVDGGWLNLGMK
tara:strand:- start:16511 stop:17233 length:723 start_codon:yes stop_codon:yes gene_type:complete